MQHHLHLEVVDCGKEGLHSAALPLSLPLPINTNNTKEEMLTKLDHKKSSLSKEEEEEEELANMASKNKGQLETSWSLSLSPWRVKLSLIFSHSISNFMRTRNTSVILISHWICHYVVFEGLRRELSNLAGSDWTQSSVRQSPQLQ